MASDSGREFSTSQYWDDRYGKNDEDAKQYEWLRRFESLKPFLSKHLPSAERNSSILHLGNGNSTLPLEMHSELGYGNQTAVDFSDVVTTNMRNQYPSDGVDWQTADIRALSFPDASFDVCIDKATLDAMLYGSLWDPEPEVRVNIEAYVDGVARVLKPGGIWLYITWRQPHFLRPLLQREAWDLEVEILNPDDGGFEYFGFIMRKHGKP